MSDVTEDGALTVAEQAELANLEGAMADTTAWGNDKASQQRALELYAKAEGEASEIGRLSKTNARIAEIEAKMEVAGGYSEYWNNPALQSEYRALLEGGDQQLAALEQRHDERQADPEQQQALAGEVGKRMDVALGDALGDIEASWDGLADTLQGAISREMAQGLPADVEPAGDEVLAKFRQTPTGSILSSWWGRDAAHYLGVLCGRMDRLEATLSDEDIESWQDWIGNRLSAEELAKVLHEAVQ